MARVLARDFLPFVKQIFDSLYSEERVEQLALSSPYALQHATPPGQPGTRGIGAKPTLELQMKLDIAEIYEPLRSVAPEVIKEVEAARKKPELLTQREEEVAIATALGVMEEEGVEGVTVAGEEEGAREEDQVGQDSSTMPAHQTIKETSKQD